MYRNGSVYSTADPLATAMLVDGDTVAWVGSEHAATSILDSKMQVVDLQGALVAPGFVDSHVHLTETGIGLSSLDLSAVRSLGELLDAVAGAAAAQPAGIILGHGWDESEWPERRVPSAAELDAASGGRRVYLARTDVHCAVVSGALAADLGLAGYDGWEDGFVVRDAHAAARRAAREFSLPERAGYQQAALRAAAAAGIVAVAEMAAPHIGTVEDLRQLLGLEGSLGEAPLPQVLGYWGQAVATEQEARDVAALFEGRLRGLAGDLNIDGSIGARTARLRAPYADAPDELGTLFLTAEEAGAHLAAATAAGLQGGFHVIGDGGLDVALEALRIAAKLQGEEAVRARHHRFEHVEMADDAAIAELVRFGVTAGLQPVFDALWGAPEGLYSQRLGADRAAGMNRTASLLSAGVPVAFGSDSPVTSLDPWSAVRAAVMHHNRAERVSARAAFIASTRAGWRAAGGSNPMLGQLGPGTPASFAVWEVEELMVQAADPTVQAWSTDPRARTPLLPALDTDHAPRCLQTVHHGTELYRSDDFGA